MGCKRSKSNGPGTCFHYRFYRYVRMMLRWCPEMRREKLGRRLGPGVKGICLVAARRRHGWQTD